MTLSKIAPTEICTEDLKVRKVRHAKAADTRLPENFEPFCLISFHGSITRDERKIVLDRLPDEHPAKHNQDKRRQDCSRAACCVSFHFRDNAQINSRRKGSIRALSLAFASDHMIA